MSILVREINLAPQEGPIELLGKVKTCKSFAEADRILAAWSRLVPHTARHGYRTSFRILFEDGEEYSGTYGLRSHQDEMPCLAWHVNSMLLFYAGLKKPANLSDVQYETFLSVQERSRDEVLAYMRKYDFGLPEAEPEGAVPAIQHS